MSAVSVQAREMLLPVIRDLIRQHNAQRCHIREGADERALEACVASLKADEEMCQEDA